jgi:hypothetical protein
MRTEDCRGSRKKQETIALCFQGADRTRGALPPEVRDKNFAVAIAGVPLGGVGELSTSTLDGCLWKRTWAPPVNTST